MAHPAIRVGAEQITIPAPLFSFRFIGQDRRPFRKPKIFLRARPPFSHIRRLAYLFPATVLPVVGVPFSRGFPLRAFLHLTPP